MVTQEEIEEIISTYYGERKPVHNPRVLHADGATISVEWWLDGIVRVKALRPGPGNSDYQILSDI